MKSGIAVATFLLFTSPVMAQTASSPAKSIGMLVYPVNRQTASEQLRDEADCYISVQRNNATDPHLAPPPNQESTQQPEQAQAQAYQEATWMHLRAFKACMDARGYSIK